MLRQAISWPVYLGVKPPLGPKPNFCCYQTVSGVLMWGALSDEWTRLLFTIAAGTRQRTHSHIRVPRDPWPHFTLSDSILPKPGGPGSHFHFRQEQSGPVITPGTRFPFRRLLRLAGQSQSPSQSHIATDGQSISKSWYRGPSGAHVQIFITLWRLPSCFCGAPSLTRGRVCLLYCCWTAPGNLTRVRVPWDSWPYFTVSDLRLPFSLPPTTRKITYRLFM
jgi:hypothetical protein